LESESERNVKPGDKIKPRPKFKSKPVCFWPSHHPFSQIIDYCVRGTSHPILQTCCVVDHIAELCGLLHDDIDSFLWSKGAEGASVRKIMSGLEDRVMTQNDFRAAEILYAIATQAAYEILRLYLRHRDIFDRIAPRRKIMPTLCSIHPGTAKVVERMQSDSRLGTQTDQARQVGSKAYFISDNPANVYARAIVECVEFNRELEPLSCQEWRWKQFDKKEGFQTEVLPYPKYVAGLGSLPSFSPASVMDYWRKGKEIISEEIPEFHLRPEWENHRRRRYKTGSKTGAVQHAIFKDILAALRTIAGSNHRRAASKSVTK
jgi:hypothetical protein